MIDLNLLMPEFSEKLKEFVIEAQYQGLDVDVESGFRSSQDQDKLYLLGRTIKNPDGITRIKPMGNIVTNAKGSQSWHNYGVAADVVFRINGNWDWNRPSSDYLKLADVAHRYGLGWGGSWKGPSGKALGDLDHFELTGGLTIVQAQQLGPIQNVWKTIREKI